MKKIFYFIAITSLWHACATVSSPSGGAKDTTAPKVLSSNPDSAQTNFKGTTLEIKFDEYIVLNNIQNQLIISPPLDKTPEFKTKGKKLIITIKEKLKENTTYQFNFGDAIKDLNEGNILKNYQLVFSTGANLDSHQLSGKVLNAETLKPEKDIKVFLYKEINDSNLLINKPYYVTKTDESGRFTFIHIANEKYQIYALKDVNNNYKAEKDEWVDFADSTIVPDSTIHQLKIAKQESNDTLSVKSDILNANGEQHILFNQSVKHKSFDITLNTGVSNKNKREVILHRIQSDTLIIYHSSSIKDSDSLFLQIKTEGFSYSSKNKIKPFRLPKIKASIPSQVSPHETLNITLSSALKKYRSDNLFILQDSIIIPVELITKKDPIHYQLKSKALAEGKKYKLVIGAQTFTDIHNRSNEPDTLNFTTFSSDKTGSLEINVAINDSTAASGDYVIQLFQKEKLIKEFTRQKSSTYNFKYLKPGKYQLRAFYDRNKNGIWDGVNLLQKTHAEKVYLFEKDIEVRSNWELKDITLFIW